MAKPAFSNMKKDDLARELRKWDPEFLDDGLTKDMMATMLKKYQGEPGRRPGGEDASAVAPAEARTPGSVLSEGHSIEGPEIAS